MKFSVVTPSYEQGEYLGETVESVLGQKGDFQIEYWVMDGGSKDHSVEVLKTYEKMSKNSKIVTFKWISQKDKGQVDAINRGIQKCTGEIRTYINSDDVYLPEAFETVNKYFREHPKKEWVVGDCEVSAGKLNWTFWLKHMWPIDKWSRSLLIFNTINQPAVFLKKELIQKVGMFDDKYHYAFDYDYWLRCIKISLPGRIHVPLAKFRIHKMSKGNTGFDKQFTEDFQVVRNFTDNYTILFIHRIADKFVKWYYKLFKS